MAWVLFLQLPRVVAPFQSGGAAVTLRSLEEGPPLSLAVALKTCRNGAVTVSGGCSENADAHFASLPHEVTASTEPRMERAAIGRAHRSLVLAALFVRGSVLATGAQFSSVGGERCAGHGEIVAEGQAHNFHPLGVNGLPVMKRSMLGSGKAPPYPSNVRWVHTQLGQRRSSGSRWAFVEFGAGCIARGLSPAHVESRAGGNA